MKIFVIPSGMGKSQISAVLRREPTLPAFTQGGVSAKAGNSDRFVAELFMRDCQDWQYDDVTSAEGMKRFGVPVARFDAAVDEVFVDVVVDDLNCDASICFGSASIFTTHEAALAVVAFFGLRVRDACGLHEVDVARCGSEIPVGGADRDAKGGPSGWRLMLSLNIIFVALSIIGNKFIRRRDRRGWWLWLPGNLVAVVFFALNREWWTTALYVYFSLAAALAIREWRRKEIIGAANANA